MPSPQQADHARQARDARCCGARLTGTLDLQMSFTYTSHRVGDSYDVNFITSVPEPSALLLTVLGLGLLVGVARFRRFRRA